MAKVTVTGGAVESYPLTYNDIKNVPGLYENRDGDVLHVFSKATVFVADSGMKTGYTRAGQAMYDKSKGFRARKVACGKGPDGERKWRKFEGKITLSN